MRWKWILGIPAGVVLAFLIIIIIIVSTYEFNKLKPQITGIVKEYTGRELTIAGDIKLGLSLYPTLEMNNIAFQNATWGSHPEMVTIKQIEIQVALLPLIRGDIKVKNLLLIEPDYIIEIDKSGKTNMEFEVPEKPPTEAEEKVPEEHIAAIFGFKDISVKNGKLTFYDHRDNSKNVLILEEYIRKAADFRAESEMELLGSYNNYPIKVQGKAGSLANIFDFSEKWDVHLSANAFESNITVTGSILNVMNLKGIDLNLSVKGDDLARLEKVTRKPLPIKGPFSVSGHLVASTLDKIEISEISILLGESKIGGSVTIDQSSEKPRITANLTAETLDLRSIIAQEAEKTYDTQKKTTKSKQKSDKVFPNTPLQLEGLHHVNATIDLRAKQMLLPKLALDNFKTKVILNDGHLKVNPFEAEIGGGKMVNYLDLQAQGSQATAKIKVSVLKLDLGEMMTKLAISNVLEGVLDLDIQLRGQGTSVAELMAGLNGDAVAILGESKMPVEYLNLVGADFTSSLMRLINPFSEKIDRAQINCAVCDFNIKNGIATTDVLMLDDPQKTLISNGKIDLKTEKLEFRIETKPKEGIGTQQTGTLSISLSKITKPFKLGGTLASPSLEMDLTKTATTIGTALLGPAGWAYLLVTGSSGKKSPCDVAREAAGEGTPKTKTKSAKKKGGNGTSEKKKESLGSKIKGLFSKPKD